MLYVTDAYDTVQYGYHILPPVGPAEEEQVAQNMGVRQY